jgi:hypothetical protein
MRSMTAGMSAWVRDVAGSLVSLRHVKSIGVTEVGGKPSVVAMWATLGSLNDQPAVVLASFDDVGAAYDYKERIARRVGAESP